MKSDDSKIMHKIKGIENQLLGEIRSLKAGIKAIQEKLKEVDVDALDVWYNTVQQEEGDTKESNADREGSDIAIKAIKKGAPCELDDVCQAVPSKGEVNFANTPPPTVVGSDSPRSYPIPGAAKGAEKFGEGEEQFDEAAERPDRGEGRGGTPLAPTVVRTGQEEKEELDKGYAVAIPPADRPADDIAGAQDVKKKGVEEVQSPSHLSAVDGPKADDEEVKRGQESESTHTGAQADSKSPPHLSAYDGHVEKSTESTESTGAEKKADDNVQVEPRVSKTRGGQEEACQAIKACDLGEKKKGKGSSSAQGQSSNSKRENSSETEAHKKTYAEAANPQRCPTQVRHNSFEYNKTAEEQAQKDDDQEQEKKRRQQDGIGELALRAGHLTYKARQQLLEIISMFEYQTQRPDGSGHQPEWYRQHHQELAKAATKGCSKGKAGEKATGEKKGKSCRFRA